MRLTRVLCKESHRWRKKIVWKKFGQMTEPPSHIPKYITNAGLHVEDPRDTYLAKPIVEYPDLPVLQAVGTKEVDITSDPNYHEEPIYGYDGKRPLLEGLKQALVLTKTSVMSENSLPIQCTENIGKLSIPRQDEIMQRVIMQANVWDPTKDKLPRRFNPQMPGWKFKAEWGIPDYRTIFIMLSGLMRITQMSAAFYPELARTRKVAKKAIVSTHYHYKNSPIQISGNFAYSITSDSSLPTFASEEEVDETTLAQIPSLYPIAPTIDLKKLHVYTLDNVNTWKDGFSHSEPHTIFINNVFREHQTKTDTRGLMFAFANCLARARQLYGPDIQTLPEPITSQCVVCNKTTFNIYAFQLNTLDFSQDGGIKNMLWMDTGNMLYNKIVPKRAMLRNSKYEDYDSSVLEKLLALYATGWEIDADQRLSARS